MDNKNDHPRNLEQIYHFFLTDNVPPQKDSGISAGNKTTRGTTNNAKTTAHQYANEYNRLKDIVAQLFVLKESCKGTHYLQQSYNDTNWFQGAEAILQDAIANLIKTLLFIDKNKI